MRAAVVAAVLAGAGLLVSSHALADTVPIPTLPTVTLPWCVNTIFCTMARPRPVPRDLDVKNGWKTFSR